MPSSIVKETASRDLDDRKVIRLDRSSENVLESSPHTSLRPFQSCKTAPLKFFAGKRKGKVAIIIIYIYYIYYIIYIIYIIIII